MSQHECIICGYMHDPERAEQDERALADAESYIEDFKRSITRVSDENITLRATLARVEGRLERHEQDHMAAMSEAQSREQALTAERDGLRGENARLAKEHTQCHEWNGKLVHEHYDLGDVIRGLRAALERYGICMCPAPKFQHGPNCGMAAALGRSVNNDPTGGV